MTDIAHLTLILGGARSGKTARAMALAEAAPTRTYIATGQAFDAEMTARIEAPQAERGAGWQTVEAPLDVAAVIRATQGMVLLDCLTLWLSNLMHAGRDTDAETAALLQAIAARPAPLICVSNEVGLGIVPSCNKCTCILTVGYYNMVNK